MTGPRRALRIALALLLGLEGFFVFAVVWTTVVTGKPRVADFAPMYAAALLAHRGEPAAAYDFDRVVALQKEVVTPDFPKRLSFSYPPYWLMTLRPLAPLGYHPALALWVLLQLALFLAALRALAPREPASLRGELIPLALAFPAVILNLSYGQNGLLSAGLLTLGLAWLGPRPAAAGVVFAALAYKPQIAALVPVALVAGRHWTALASCAVAWCSWVGVSWAWGGTALWSAFLARLAEQAGTLGSGELPLPTMTTVYAGGRMLGVPLGAARVAQGLVSLAALALVVRSFARREPLPRRATFLALGALLFTPQGVAYDLAVLAPALLFLAAAALRADRRGVLGLVVLAWLGPVLGPWLAKKTDVPWLPLGNLALLLVALHVLPLEEDVGLGGPVEGRLAGEREGLEETPDGPPE